ncbi:hypothetical protein Q8F55_004003 [Vanrija albida]|uniref:Uncharacterized protein n=1 Tax=Vanrija albida TaxID=181172 RepID=A0ABR3Q5J5_9TREE
METMATTTAQAGPSRRQSAAGLSVTGFDTRIADFPHAPSAFPNGMATAALPPTATTSAPSSILSNRPYAHSLAASASDSGSTRSLSVHSRERNLAAGIFGRRGSAAPGSARPPTAKSLTSSSNRSYRSNKSNRSDDGSGEQMFEMTAVTLRAGGKKRVHEDPSTRIDRRKAEAAMQKWRKWIVEQPTQPSPAESNPLFGPPQSLAEAARYSPAPTPPATQASFLISPRGSLAGPSSLGHGVMSSAATHTSDHSHIVGPGTPVSTSTALHPGQDIYTTESTRALRDVELAIDPGYFGGDTTAPAQRTRRLSTHPRVSSQENPFSFIDTLLSRRGIRPLVIELVISLGAYVDAVWSTTQPDQPCPWTGMPMPTAQRRVSFAAGAVPSRRTWRSWTITAVQEAKKRGFLSNPQTQTDVDFWGYEIRYGLRDTDEAVNRRKDMGWAFGEAVIRGQYGDIVPANVFATDGGGGNIPRLLNDLEEALWGDAMPASSDLAFEHDGVFDPFSVYREGDDLIGVDSQNKNLEQRDAELRKVFGDAFSAYAPRPPSGIDAPRQSIPAYSPEHPPPPLSSPSSPVSAKHELSLRTPGDQHTATMPDLDFSVLGALQEMSMEEKLELGRRRHQEYLERMRAEGERKGVGEGTARAASSSSTAV